LNYFGLTNKFTKIFHRHIDSEKNRINKYEFAITQLNISVHSVVVFENEKKEIEDALKIGIPVEKIINL
jgi:beta-phosphoglucomutase